MTKPDASLLDDVVGSRVRDALQLASEALIAANVRHVVVGGLAVCANGHQRNANRIELLVGEEAFVRCGKVVSWRAGVPFEVDGIAIELVFPAQDEPFLETALSAPPGSFIDAAQLVYLKLKASRMQDRADVVALIKSSLDVEACRAYLATNAPALVSRFNELVAIATSEMEQGNRPPHR